MRIRAEFGLIVSLLAALSSGGIRAQDQVGVTAESVNPVVVIETSKGRIEVELLPEQAPKTVRNFLQYVDEGFYSDTIFHRVIPGKIIQGGGYTPELEEKPTRDPVEIESDNGLSNVRGTVAMARSDDKDSATSQFFVNVGDNADFDRSARRFGYTVFGRVIGGMDVVDRISKVQRSRRGPFEDIPILPVYIETIRRAETPDGAQR